FMIGVAAAAFVGILSGYYLGAGSWPGAWRTPAPAVSVQQSAAAHKVLYWKDPDGKAEFAPVSKKTADGRDYLPVYDEEERPLAGTQSQKGKGRGKILYYRNPMGLPDTSPVPKKDWMGMDYIPVYENDERDPSAVRVSLDRVQRAGVRSEAAALRILARPVKAPGIAKPNERTLRSVSLRVDGFIDKLIVNATGEDI